MEINVRFLCVLYSEIHIKSHIHILIHYFTFQFKLSILHILKNQKRSTTRTKKYCYFEFSMILQS